MYKKYICLVVHWFIILCWWWCAIFIGSHINENRKGKVNMLTRCLDNLGEILDCIIESGSLWKKSLVNEVRLGLSCPAKLQGGCECAGEKNNLFVYQHDVRFPNPPTWIFNSVAGFQCNVVFDLWPHNCHLAQVNSHPPDLIHTENHKESKESFPKNSTNNCHRVQSLQSTLL